MTVECAIFLYGAHLTRSDFCCRSYC